jgi:hypothetical protein
MIVLLFAGNGFEHGAKIFQRGRVINRRMFLIRFTCTQSGAYQVQTGIKRTVCRNGVRPQLTAFFTSALILTT